nr:NAD-dependent epimerase [Deltaproteobacteria bacterium]
PETANAAVFRPDAYARIVSGSTVYMAGNPDTPHSYSYTPDVARGLAVLGVHPAAVGRAWHLPVAAQLTTRELADRFAAHAGTSVKVRRIPQWALRTLGLMVPVMSALAEMTYQWDAPYLMDDGDFRRTFAVGPTPLAEAIAQTLAPHITARAA